MKVCVRIVMLGVLLCARIFSCTGTFVNPITDIDWGCLFPIAVCGVFLGDDTETTHEDAGIICWCKKRLLPEPGVPIGFGSLHF